MNFLSFGFFSCKKKKSIKVANTHVLTNYLVLGRVLLKLHEVTVLHESLRCKLSHPNRCNKTNKVTQTSVKLTPTYSFNRV